MNIKILGAEVRRLRMAKGWSQEALAQAAKVGPRTVQRVETASIGRASTASSLAAALETTIESITTLSAAIPGRPADLAQLQQIQLDMEALRRKTEPRRVPSRILSGFAIIINPVPGVRYEASSDPFQDAIRALRFDGHVHFLVDAYDNETIEFGNALLRRVDESDVPTIAAIGRFQWIPPGVTVLVQDADLWGRVAEILRIGFATVPTAAVYGPDQATYPGLHGKSKQKTLILVGRR